jgi:tRNA-splicing ligase RtcB (3'-phosphate/5'-hydroxy nucleic acid ligase)
MEQLADKLYSWASILERNTREQARKASTMPFVYPHLALMPDAHLGKGATVGSVIPTLHAIMPAAVGVDIGCGMMAVRTQFTMSDIEGKPLSPLREAIEEAIPLSAGNYNQEWWGRLATRRRVAELEALDGADSAEAISPNWRLQLGSLGSGNHFIEVSRDEVDRVWLFLHSGSRGVGNRLAQMHIRKAQEICKRRKISLPDPDLAYLDEADGEFWDYITDLRWAQHFALLNRDEMMDRVVSAFGEWIGDAVTYSETVRCHHNYTMRESHFGKDVWLSRKGAIDASEGTMGLIPGSMGDASYVVEGKGNAMALNSSPHGAGRNFSRSAAKKTFTMEQLEESMKGIEWRHSPAFLDEISGAYKPVEQVMQDAADLVEIRHTLRQFVNVKGD